MARNSLGGFYDSGKPLPSNARNEIVNLFNAGLGLSDIPRKTRVRKGAVHKIVRHLPPPQTLRFALWCECETQVTGDEVQGRSDTIQSTRQLNHFLVEVKILDKG